VVVALLVGFMPAMSLANYAPLALSPTTTVNPLPLLCYDFKTNLKTGSSGDAVRRLQFFLLDTGYDIPAAEYGQYGNATFAAVKSFQEKYKDDILAPNGLTTGNGYVGKSTRAKLTALYGCDTLSKQIGANSANVKLNITNVSLDSNGINITACNQGQDVPTFPLRIRVNGVIRDFDILSARKGGACSTESFSYSTWGFSYDLNSSYTVITVLDPLGVYKNGKLQYADQNGTQFNVPAISGAHLAVRGLILTSTGVQATFCNQGTNDLTNFPTRVNINGITKDFDIVEVHPKATCKNRLFAWSDLGISYVSGTTYTATVKVDPDNVINEVNEFDNAATVVGKP
jgi:peptidoglycan hydrolase-like protein with peptidoglycan-binding domain